MTQAKVQYSGKNFRERKISINTKKCSNFGFGKTENGFLAQLSARKWGVDYLGKEDSYVGLLRFDRTYCKRAILKGQFSLFLQFLKIFFRSDWCWNINPSNLFKVGKIRQAPQTNKHIRAPSRSLQVPCQKESQSRTLLSCKSFFQENSSQSTTCNRIESQK